MNYNRIVSKISMGMFGCVFVICLVFFSSVEAQTITPIEAECKLFVANGLWGPKEEPLLLGPEFRVPELRFRFVEAAHQSKDSLKKIRVFYAWESLEYPDRRNRPSGG